MKKLRLKLEDLEVRSFDTTADESARRGTVAAHEGSVDVCTGGCSGDLGYTRLPCGSGGGENTANYSCNGGTGCPATME